MTKFQLFFITLVCIVGCQETQVVKNKPLEAMAKERTSETERKLFKIIDWYSEIADVKTNKISKQNNFENIKEIEKMLGESFPKSILEFYKKYDGDEGMKIRRKYVGNEGFGRGSFLGHSLIGLEGIKNYLVFANKLVKPENPKILNPIESEDIINKILEVVKTEMRVVNRKWHKIQFKCGPSYMNELHSYSDISASDKERELIRLGEYAQGEITKLIKQLDELEKPDYNWDYIQIVAFADGNKIVNRNYYGLNIDSSLTSTPKEAIKKKYRRHTKWIPLISDSYGNYIGLDLDPDKKGVKGQIIIYGQDDLYVIANSWDEFLDFNLELIEKNEEILRVSNRFYDLYKDLMQ